MIDLNVLSKVGRAIKLSVHHFMERTFKRRNNEWHLYVDVFIYLGYHIFVGKIYGFARKKDRDVTLVVHTINS